MLILPCFNVRNDPHKQVVIMILDPGFDNELMLLDHKRDIEEPPISISRSVPPLGTGTAIPHHRRADSKHCMIHDNEIDSLAATSYDR